MTNEELWQALEEEARSRAKGTLVRRIHPESRCDMFLGLQRPEDRRVFLLGTDSIYLPPPESLPQAKGIEVLGRSVSDWNGNRSSIELYLRDARFKDIFTALVDDLASRIAPLQSDEQAVSTFISRLLRWQKFLESDVEGLGIEAQKGLYGELYFLREYVFTHLGPRGILTWTGPRRSAQDFQFGRWAVEVKTSAANLPTGIHISSEYQLDDSNLDVLFLYYLSVEQSLIDSETLVDIVRSIRERLASDPAASEAFEDSLLDAGYLDAHAFLYSSYGFHLRGSSFYRVIEGFPRITAKDLPLGVGEVSYYISVTECSRFMVPVSEVVIRLNAGEG